MNCTISVVPQALKNDCQHSYPDKIIIFIDLFFATTTLINSLQGNLKRIYIASDKNSFIENVIKNPFRAVYSTEHGLFERYLRDSDEVRNLSISPSTPIKLSRCLTNNETLVLWSHRGTPGILAIKESKMILIGSMTNLATLSDYVSSNYTYNDVVIVCAGGKNNSSIEDLWCAGAFIKNLIMPKKIEKSILLDQYAKFSLDLFMKSTPEFIVRNSPVAQLAIQRGDAEEIYFSIKENTSEIIPFMKNYNIVERL